MGGSEFCLKLNNDKNHKIQYYPNVERQALINEDIQMLDGKGHLYFMRHINTEIPMLIPFLPSTEYKDNGIECNMYPDSTITFFRSRMMPLEGYLPNEGLEYLGRNGGMALMERGTEFYGTKPKLQEYVATFVSAARNYNTMNFFTAADLTQCSYEVNVYSACPIDFLRFNFNIPVELSPLYLKTDTMDAYGFQITDKTTLANFSKVNKGDYGHLIRFHVKLPTLANMQLIRSLILTTLLTTFVTLFLSALYYRLKKSIYNLYLKREMQLNDTFNRMNKRKKTLKILLYGIVLLIAYVVYKLCIMVLYDDPIKIGLSNWNTFKILFPLAVLFLIVVPFFIFSKIIANRKKKKK